MREVFVRRKVFVELQCKILDFETRKLSSLSRDAATLATVLRAHILLCSGASWPLSSVAAVQFVSSWSNLNTGGTDRFQPIRSL